MAQNKDYFTELLKSIYTNSLNDISVAYIAKITKLTPPTASIQPLARLTSGKQNMVSKAHFLINPIYKELKDEKVEKVKLDYKTGDEVIVVCLDDDNSKYTKGQFPASSKIKHSIDYAFVIGKIATKSDFK